jgi:SAM-dependent methyltransferase
MKDTDQQSAGNQDAIPEAEAIAERLKAIVRTCAGCNVDTDGEDLWFGIESGGDLQIRLSADREARCYDRSVNFAISYGGQPSDEPVSARFRATVDRIKAIDTSPLAELAMAFRPAALAIARRLSSRDADEPPPAPVVATTGTQFGSESSLGRALNIIFLDLFVRLAGEAPEPLRPMHWGFWPTVGGAPAHTSDAYDPLEAFSINLLSHVPESATRILDVGCGLGFDERILSARGKRVTAISPVPHHCAVIEHARLPNVDVRCTRFEDLAPAEPFDLLLFAESVNYFMLNAAFMRHCARFLTDSGFLLMADDLSAESVRQIEEQEEFRVLRASDITANVAPTADWFAGHLPTTAAYHRAMMATLELYDAPLAARVRTILDSLENSDLKALFSGRTAPPAPKGRYMIFLLQRVAPAAPG